MVSYITLILFSSAPTATLPVDVFIKSALHFKHILVASLVCSSFNNPDSTITFYITGAPFLLVEA